MSKTTRGKIKMSTISYDLDTSGGLMPIIRALIKPPDEDINVQKPKKPHPYYKRPGKGHNHDSCDACGEGGDLICCDRCPASFHLGCYDPPLELNDIPAGQWLCKQCKGNEEDKPASTKSSRAQSPVDVKPKEDIEKKTRSLRNNRSNSNQSTKKKNKDPKDKEDNAETRKKVEDESNDNEESAEENSAEDKKKEEKELSPMEILVKAAKIMNPKQFELPREMRVPCEFPGTEKEEDKDGNCGPSIVTMDAWGCVPLPAKTCFVCQRTCKMAPLLQCDYCPLLFHQDCLDPPLTALPTGRWMCPNHVEQYIDWKLVNSISATERVALWERFSGPVDQHAIKIDFIRRARSAKPAFRIKVPVGVRGRVIVPGVVRAHYRHPPPLLPSRREYVRCRNALKQLQSRGEYEETDREYSKKHVICLNLSCPKYTEGGICPHEGPTLEGVSEDDAASDLKAITENRPISRTTESVTSDSDVEVDPSLVPLKRRKMSQEDVRSPKRKVDKEQRLELRADEADAAEMLAIVENQLKKLDERLVKLLAWQRLQQLLTGERCAGPWRRAPLSAKAEALVNRSIDRGRLARHGFKHVSLPSQLLSRADHERIARAVWGAPDEPGDEPPSSPGHSLSDTTVKATLCPVERPARDFAFSGGLGDGLGRPVPMRLSRLSVGRGAACDVPLARYGKCRFTSPLHALIFYDEVSRHFELINYSEWGSRVNGALYTCDVRLASPPQPEHDEGEERANAVREIARRRQRPLLRLNGDLTVERSETQQCRCPPGVPDSSGAWEGSALLTHGALLQFGCIMFVFSVTDELPTEDEESS